MDTGARINGVIDSPIMTFTAIGEGSSDFLEAGIQGEIVSDRVLPARRGGFKVWELGYCLLPRWLKTTISLTRDSMA